ncbi:MAG: transporter substrate-binding domain-containing protein [Geminicoccaceae bacterium]
MGADENVDDDLRNYVWKGPLIGGSVANVMMHVPFDRELDQRNEFVVLQAPYMVERIAIAFRRDAHPDNPPVPAYFRYDTVGVENDSVADFYLSNIGSGELIANMHRFRDTGEAMAAMKRGEVAAVVGPRAQLQFALDDTLDMHEPPLPGLAIGEWTLGIAVGHNYRQLAGAVEDAISAAMQDRRLTEIFGAYGLTWSAPEW